MFSSVLALALLPLVWGAADPTKVCLPDVFQVLEYNIETGERVQIAVDFKQNLLTSVSPNVTIVDDYEKLRTYTIDATGNCQYVSLSPEEVYPQCLPATSTYVGELFIGSGPSRVPAEAWDIPFKGVTMRVAYSNQPGEPRYPFMARLVDDQGLAHSSLYFDQSQNITVPNPFKIPDPCPPATVG
ncbi:unnamed protein product [Lymnaea stagnalis]|uniref:Uncharacterized protein n=1 Tax=Lymnaea stagnalis TaxID=6523 RepID=A0AAV2II37_LYMST